MIEALKPRIKKGQLLATLLFIVVLGVPVNETRKETDISSNSYWEKERQIITLGTGDIIYFRNEGNPLKSS